MKPCVLLPGDMARGMPSTSSHLPGCCAAHSRNSSTVIGVIVRGAAVMLPLPFVSEDDSTRRWSCAIGLRGLLVLRQRGSSKEVSWLVNYRRIQLAPYAPEAGSINML